MLLRVIGLGLLLAVPAVPRAADTGGSFAVKGVGLTRCKDFVAAVKEKKSDQVAMYVGWIGGFMTASNQLTTETFDLTPWQNVRTLTAALVNHCDKNADTRFGAAVVRMANALKPDRLMERSILVPIEHEGRRHYVYKEAVRRAQAALTDLGMYSGDVNGDFDAATRAALETYQKEHSLTATGLPDQTTLFRLFRKPRS